MRSCHWCCAVFKSGIGTSYSSPLKLRVCDSAPCASTQQSFMIDVLDDCSHTKMTIYPSPPSVQPSPIHPKSSPSPPPVQPFPTTPPLQCCLFFPPIRTTNVARQSLYGRRTATFQFRPPTFFPVRSRYPADRFSKRDGRAPARSRADTMDDSRSTGRRRLTACMQRFPALLPPFRSPFVAAACTRQSTELFSCDTPAHGLKISSRDPTISRDCFRRLLENAFVSSQRRN